MASGESLESSGQAQLAAAKGIQKAFGQRGHFQMLPAEDQPGSSPRVSSPLPPAESSAPGATARAVPAPKQWSVLSSPRPKAPQLAPSLAVANGRRGWKSEAPSETRSSVRHHDSHVENLQAQNAHLREELQSLRDMYATHTAYTELKCDRMIREKDQECAEWYKARKIEIKQMQATVSIMQGLFEKRKRRILAQMETDQQAYAGQEGRLQAQVAQLEEELRTVAQRFETEQAKRDAEHKLETRESQRERAEMDGKTTRLEQQVEEARREIDSLKEFSSKKTKELSEARDRLAEVEKNADIDRRDEQIANLEAELQATKRTMKDRWKKEVESLRQELMDYVRFIVHILPDNWIETDAFEKVPPELKDQLAWMANSKSKGKGGPRSKVPGSPAGKLGGFLPPTDALMKGAASSVQNARPGTEPSPRRRRPGGLDMTF